MPPSRPSKRQRLNTKSRSRASKQETASLSTSSSRPSSSSISKKSLAVVGSGATGPARRKQQRAELVDRAQEIAGQVGPDLACRALPVCRATVYRYRARAKAADQATGVAAPGQAEMCTGIATEPSLPEQRQRRRHPRALSDEEEQQVIDVLTEDRFVDQAPAEIAATLLDGGNYLCSVSTMYRLLRKRRAVRERRDQLRHPQYHKPELLATGPNQVWSWDITKLKAPGTWNYYYLYVLMDIYSRYVVGWCVTLGESAATAADLMLDACLKNNIAREQLTIHADRGSAMTSKTVGQLLIDLDVAKTHSRPHVSNDNPYSEAQFKTLKYRPEFPTRFGSLEDARQFCADFFEWYNTQHCHSGIAMLTPECVHFGKTEQTIAARQSVLDATCVRHPERFVRGASRRLPLTEAAWINKPETGRDNAETGQAL